MDGAALDRAGPDERHLDGQVVEVLRPRARQHLHLRAALDLEDPGRLGGADPPVDLLVVERDPREVDALVPRPADLVHRALDRREHPEAEQVDLEKAGVGAGVLVPLGDLAALHRRRDDRAEVDQRPGREDHPARVLGGMAGQPVGLLDQPRERHPALRAGAPLADRLADVGAYPRFIEGVRAPVARVRLVRRERAEPPAPPARSPRSAARAPCRGRELRPSSGRWGRRRPAPSARSRSARGSSGSAARGRRGGSRGRCRAPR